MSAPLTRTLDRLLKRVFLTHLLDVGPATTDVLRERVALPTYLDPRAIGGVVRQLADERLIRSAGREQSARPEADERWIELWTITSRSSVIDWLRCHPELNGDGELFPPPCNQPW